MSKEQIQNIFNLLKAPSFVTPVTDYQIGRAMFNNRFAMFLCGNSEQRRGWEAACEDALRLAYAEGGVKCGDAVATAVNELDLMAQDLDAMRAEDDEWTRPFARLTDEQLDEIEDCRPGEYEFEHRGAW